MTYSYWAKTWLIAILLVFISVASLLVNSGCQRKEKVLEVRTPGADVEVERDKPTGRVDVEVNK